MLLPIGGMWLNAHFGSFATFSKSRNLLNLWGGGGGGGLVPTPMCSISTVVPRHDAVFLISFRPF